MAAPKAFSMGSAISGERAALPFTKSDKLRGARRSRPHPLFSLVRSRSLGLVDDEHLNRGFGLLKSQPNLRFERRLERGSGGIDGSFGTVDGIANLRVVAEIEVVGPGQPSAVEDRSVVVGFESRCQPLHGDATPFVLLLTSGLARRAGRVAGKLQLRGTLPDHKGDRKSTRLNLQSPC